MHYSVQGPASRLSARAGRMQIPGISTPDGCLPGAFSPDMQSEEPQNRRDIYKCFAYGIINEQGLEALHEGPA